MSNVNNINKITFNKDRVSQLLDIIIKNSYSNILDLGEKFNLTKEKIENKESNNPYVLKADLETLTTENIKEDKGKIKLTYNCLSPLVKKLNITSDVEIEFEADERIGIPTSLIYIEAENSAKIEFKNITKNLSNEEYTIDEDSYGMFVNVAKVGSEWYIMETKVIGKEGEDVTDE